MLFKKDEIKKLKEHKSFCLYPWVNINCDTDGKVKLCCNIEDAFYLKDFDGSPFELGKDSIIKDVWNSDAYKDVRKQLLEGKRIETCKSCWRLEDNGEASPRTDFLNRMIDQEWVQDILVEAKEDFTIERPPGSVEFRLGNTCNLMCNSCYGKSSRPLANEREEILTEHYSDGKYHIPKRLLNYWEQNERPNFGVEYKWHESDIFIDDLEKLSWWSFRAYLTGGEPTLIKANHKYLDMLIEKKKFNTEVQITTNLQAWDQSLSEKISKFERGEIQVSIDGFKEVNNYIRYPSRWEKTEKNFERIIALPENVKITVLTVLQYYNVLDLVNLLEWLKEKSKNRIIHWYPVRLHSPIFLQTSLAQPEDIQKGLKALREKFEKYLEPGFDKGNFYCDHGIREAIKHYQVGFEVDWFQDDTINIHQARKILKAFTAINDAKRNVSFSETFKDLTI